MTIYDLNEKVMCYTDGSYSHDLATITRDIKQRFSGKNLNIFEIIEITKKMIETHPKDDIHELKRFIKQTSVLLNKTICATIQGLDISGTELPKIVVAGGIFPALINGTYKKTESDIDVFFLYPTDDTFSMHGICTHIKLKGTNFQESSQPTQYKSLSENIVHKVSYKNYRIKSDSFDDEDSFNLNLIFMKNTDSINKLLENFDFVHTMIGFEVKSYDSITTDIQIVAHPQWFDHACNKKLVFNKRNTKLVDIVENLMDKNKYNMNPTLPRVTTTTQLSPEESAIKYRLNKFRERGYETPDPSKWYELA